MAKQPLTTCMKGVFLIFNFVFWVTGLALLVVGILTKFSFAYIMKLSTEINYDVAPYIIIGCGVFIILVGFIGCWAAVKEHSWALKIYMFVLILLFICEIIGGITGYIMRNKMSGGLNKGLTNAVTHYNKDKDLSDGMDQVQQKIKCCGVTTYKDYFHNKTETVGNKTKTVEVMSVPQSCCMDPDSKDCKYKDLKGVKVTDMGIYTKGCYDTLLHEAEKNILIVGGVALGIAVFQILGVVSAFILTKQFNNNNYETMT